MSNNHNHSPNSGMVFKKTLGTYFVNADGETVVCSISSKLRKHLVYSDDNAAAAHRRVVEVKDIKMVDPVAVGDVVQFTDAGEGSGMITDILPRKNSLSRRAPGTKPLEQVIVANVDQVVIVMAGAQPSPRWNLLDRYLVSAESAGIPPLICITKMDVADEDEIGEAAQVYAGLGYTIMLTSSSSGRGIEQVREALAGRMSAFVGQSGVGKTSLLNAVQPELGLRVNAVSSGSGKGKHTTTHLEMFALEGGGTVVDTPGMREFGLWEVDGSDLALLFPEMRPYAGLCKFGADCTHEHEPGCAIKRAVEAGDIDERRYSSYLRMRD